MHENTCRAESHKYQSLERFVATLRHQTCGLKFECSLFCGLKNVLLKMSATKHAVLNLSALFSVLLNLSATKHAVLFT